jgi:hypothetical protein
MLSGPKPGGRPGLDGAGQIFFKRRRITSSATSTAIFFMFFRLRLIAAVMSICRVSAPKYRAESVQRVIRTLCDPGFVSVYTLGTRTIRAAKQLILGLLTVGATACGSTSAPNPIDTPDPSFGIEIRYWGTPPPPALQVVIERAAARWESLVTRGLPTATVRGDAGCGPGSPGISGEVDDIVVFVRVLSLTALAESGPCKLREGSLLPITATVWLDGPSRIEGMSESAFEALVTHELAHALGFGTLWEARSLLREPAVGGGFDPHFAGPQAISAFDAIGGDAYGGSKVPLERFGGPGTADSHWRNDVFGDAELMSYTIRSGENPLSPVTAAAMADLGYDIDLAQADDYTLPGAAARSAIGPPIDAVELTESEPRWPLTVTDRAGLIVREVTRR